MMPRFRTALLATAALLTALLTVSPTSARSHQGADEVRAWNAITMTSLVTAATPVAEQPLHLAYVHRAVYDGVRKAVRRHGGASVPATVSTAAYTVLSADFPAQQEALKQQYDAALASVPNDARRRAGIRIGRRAADRLLADRADDGRNGATVPVPPSAPGVWSPLPPNLVGASSWLGSMRPFTLRTPDQFRPPPPPALDSMAWARDYEETRILGSAASTARTAAQTEVARFWSDPPLVQNQRGLRAYSVKVGLGPLATARLFALADTASADALIACWDAKYHYELWRPVKAVPQGDLDGNPLTVGDPGWTPLLPTPNFPEYPSAHSCSTTAIATVVAALAHGRLDLDLDSTVTGTVRHYSSVRQLVAEVSDARVWGGLHWRFSTTAGERIGTSVAHRVLKSEQH